MDTILEETNFVLTEPSFKEIGPNVDKYSTRYYKAIVSVSDGNPNKAVRNVINILNNKEILVESGGHDINKIYKAHVTLNTRIIVYNTMKYFDYRAIDVELVNDLHKVLISRIDINQHETTYLLKGLKYVYEKQEFKGEKDDLMKIFRKLFYSPLDEIQSAVRKVVSVIVTWYSQENMLKELDNFLSVQDWDNHHYFIVSTLISKYNGSFDDLHYQSIIECTFKGLAHNYCSYAASIMFVTVIKKCEFKTFEDKIFPVLKKYLTQKEILNRTLTSSINKYVIPSCSEKYRTCFYYLCINLPELNLHYYINLISYCLKYGLSKMGNVFKTVAACLKADSANRLIAFEVMCRYRKLMELILPSHFAVIKEFIRRVTQYSQSFMNSFEYFISHISVSFVDLNACDGYIEFFEWLYDMCMRKLEENDEDILTIFGNMFSSTLKILTGSSKELKSDYHLPVNKRYSEFENPVYCELLKQNKFYFTSKYTVHKFLLKFINNDCYVFVISHIITEYLLKFVEERHIIQIEEHLDFLLFISNNCASKRAAYYIEILFKYYDKHENECLKLFKTTSSVLKLQFKEIRNGSMCQTIKKYPLFIVAQCLLFTIQSKYLRSDDLLTLFDEIQEIITYVMNNIGIYNPEVLFLESRNNKAVEHTIIACIDIMYSILAKLSFPEDFTKIVLEILTRVIADSNMKRPVSHAKIKLELLLLRTPWYTHSYMKFYWEQVESFKNKSKRSYTIRRKPGIRLVLHALLLGISTSNQEFLNNAVNCLLQNGKNDESAAAVLHTLERLISFACFKSNMYSYLPQVLSLAIKQMDSQNFDCINASMQVFQAVTTRLLGQKSETGSRPLSAIDVFHIYPEIANIMLNDLFIYNAEHNMSKVAILTFLSESNYCKRMYTEANEFNFDELKMLFKYPDIGRLAVKAYVATCSVDEIGTKILEDIKFLFSCKVRCNERLYRFCAVEQLYKRYLTCNPKQEKIDRVCEELRRLSANTDITFISALPFFKIPSSLAEAFSMVHTCHISQSENCFIFILNRISPTQLCEFLNVCLHLNFRASFLYKCVYSVTELCKTPKYKNCIYDVLVMLVNFLLALRNASEFVILNFYKAIIQLIDLENNFCYSRDQFSKSNKTMSKCDLHIQHIWLLLYGRKKSELDEEERNDVKNVLQSFLEIAENGDADECYELSIMLKELYVLIQDSDRCKFLYLLLILFLQIDDTCAIEEFLSLLKGSKLRIGEYVEWLLKEGNTTFLRDCNDRAQFTTRFIKFGCKFDVEIEDKSFYARACAATEKISFTVSLFSRVCDMHKDLLCNKNF